MSVASDKETKYTTVRSWSDASGLIRGKVVSVNDGEYYVGQGVGYHGTSVGTEPFATADEATAQLLAALDSTATEPDG